MKYDQNEHDVMLYEVWPSYNTIFCEGSCFTGPDNKQLFFTSGDHYEATVPPILLGEITEEKVVNFPSPWISKEPMGLDKFEWKVPIDTDIEEIIRLKKENDELNPKQQPKKKTKANNKLVRQNKKDKEKEKEKKKNKKNIKKKKKNKQSSNTDTTTTISSYSSLSSDYSFTDISSVEISQSNEEELKLIH
ncbi:hypothetical protein M0812_11146 [Anaeramoeba flamelloides]|uniref:Uncharacterized protein n=1 Tax=Anaeramoeba flamelloides TaxID=1746091 RepID=A0AAV7ZXT2_9EUKA|nr:hypothetical protein M0812_11146 [Anaeramoeba flamelloides]